MKTKGVICILFLSLINCFISEAQIDSLVVENVNKVEGRFYYLLGFGLSAYERESGNNNYNPTFYAGAGYNWRYFVQPGLIVGYDEYNEFSGIPLQLFVQGNLLKRDHTPFYYAQAGITHFFDDDNNRFDSIEEGRVVEAGLGYTWRFEKVRLKLSGGWRRQLATTEGWGGGYFFMDRIDFSSFLPYSYQTTEWKMDRLIFKLGLEF